jgi:OOP family OmpA-OmpF porin
MRLHLLAAVSLLAASSAAFADGDAEGCKDHPAVPRFPGYVIGECKQIDFESVEFKTGEETTVTKEGKLWSIQYAQVGDKGHSCVEIFRNYANAFKKAGGKVVWVRGDNCEASLTMPLGKSERWMRLNLMNDQTLNVIDIIEVAAMEQHIEIGASEMLEALNKNGFVALHGILFDTGKDTLKPESEPLLAEIVKLLQDNTALKLSVEGHTDNVGVAKTNQKLSQQRAEAVKKYVVGKGVDAKRLEAKGWGDTKPVGDNRTEDGRAQNRRVELVKK